MWSNFVFVIPPWSNFGAAQVMFTRNELRDGLGGSRDFAYEGPINDGSANIIEKPSTTTVSPEFQRCVKNCLSNVMITDDRPVCGTDRVTYNNNEHFICAVQCGKSWINKLYTDRCHQQF